MAAGSPERILEDDRAGRCLSACVFHSLGFTPRRNLTEKSPRRVGVREFRGNLTGFLRQARQGRSFLVMSHDRVLAEVGGGLKRLLGTQALLWWLADDNQLGGKARA